MTTLTRHNRHELARRVAQDIFAAACNYTGPRWEQVEDSEKAVRFIVDVPTLQDKDFNESLRCDQEFETSVYLAQSRAYRDAAGHTRSARVLHGYGFTLEVKHNLYTGKATVWERSFDYD